MDVFLLASSFGLMYGLDQARFANEESSNKILPKFQPNSKGEEKDSKKTKNSSILNATTRVTLCLSACLFSLCFLETMPLSWLLLLHNQHQYLISSSTASVQSDSQTSIINTFSISALYKMFLWMFCIWIIVVIPVLISISFIDKLQSVSSKVLLSTHRKSAVTRLLISTMGFTQCAAVHIFKVTFQTLADLLWKKKSYEKDVKKDKESTIFQSIRISSERKYYVYTFGSLIGITFSLFCIKFLGWQQALALSFTFENEKYSRLQYFLAILVSRISNVGVLLSTLLNGFGSVSLPYSFLMAIYMKNVLTPENLSRKEADLLRTTCFLEKQREKHHSFISPRNHLSLPSDSSFHDLSLSSTSSSSSSQTGNGSRSLFWNRKSSQKKEQPLSLEHHEEILALEKEIKRLENVRSEQEDDCNELREMISASTIEIFGLKTVGKFLGGVFTVILWIRISNAIHICMTMVEENMNAQTGTINSDPISLSLNWVIDKEFLMEEDYKVFSQVLSFLLTIYLSISQVATFSRMRSNLRKQWKGFIRFFWEGKSNTLEHVHDQRPLHESSDGIGYMGDFMMNIVMGSYFLSCVVIMKINLPGAYGEEFWDALGRVHFDLNRKMINIVFLISVLASGLVLGIALRKQTLSSKMDNTFSSIALDSILYFGSGV